MRILFAFSFWGFVCPNYAMDELLKIRKVHVLVVIDDFSFQNQIKTLSSHTFSISVASTANSCQRNRDQVEELQQHVDGRDQQVTPLSVFAKWIFNWVFVFGMVF